MPSGLGKPVGMGKAGLEISKKKKVIREKRSHAGGRPALSAPSAQGGGVVSKGNSAEKDS